MIELKDELSRPKMYDHPAKLQDSCVSFICDNVEAVCEVVDDPIDPNSKVCAFKGN